MYMYTALTARRMLLAFTLAPTRVHLYLAVSLAWLTHGVAANVRQCAPLAAHAETDDCALLLLGSRLTVYMCCGLARVSRAHLTFSYLLPGLLAIQHSRLDLRVWKGARSLAPLSGATWMGWAP